MDPPRDPSRPDPAGTSPDPARRRILGRIHGGGSTGEEMTDREITVEKDPPSWIRGEIRPGPIPLGPPPTLGEDGSLGGSMEADPFQRIFLMDPL